MMPFKDIKKFMALGAHSDDVDIRFGGSFSRLKREGKEGCYVVAVDNAYTRQGYPVENSEEALRIRFEESKRASGIIGADRYECLNMKSFYYSTKEVGSRIYPSYESEEQLKKEMEGAILTGLAPVENADMFHSCCDRLKKLILDFKPDVIFSHSPDDAHQDHYHMARFVKIIVDQLAAEGERIPLYLWEPGSRGCIQGYYPNTYIEISEEDVIKKQEAIDIYESQFSKENMGAYAKACAEAYGKRIGVRYAEIFFKPQWSNYDIHHDFDVFHENQNNHSGEKTLYQL